MMNYNDQDFLSTSPDFSLPELSCPPGIFFHL